MDNLVELALTGLEAAAEKYYETVHGDKQTITGSSRDGRSDRSRSRTGTSRRDDSHRPEPPHSLIDDRDDPRRDDRWEERGRADDRSEDWDDDRSYGRRRAKTHGPPSTRGDPARFEDWDDDRSQGRRRASTAGPPSAWDYPDRAEDSDDDRSYDRRRDSTNGPLSTRGYTEPLDSRTGTWDAQSTYSRHPPDDTDDRASSHATSDHHADRSALILRHPPPLMRRKTVSVHPGHRDRFPRDREDRPHPRLLADRSHDDDARPRGRRAQSVSYPRKRRYPSPGASLAGALAGGWAGHELGKGDRVAMVAGVLLGAVGAAEADRLYDKYFDKDKREERWRGEENN